MQIDCYISKKIRMSQNNDFVGFSCLLAAILDICRYVNFIRCLVNELYYHSSSYMQRYAFGRFLLIFGRHLEF